MKSSVIVVASLAALAAATPVDKRALVTHVEWEVVTVTVTGSAPEKTGAPAAFYEPAASTPEWGGRGWGGGRWGGHGGGGAPPAAAPTEAASPPPSGYEAPSGGAPSGGAPSGGAPSGGAPPTSEAPSSPAPAGYAGAMLAAHNNARAKHGVPGLVWSDSLAGIAQQIGQKCVYAHDTSTGGGGYGQNIGAGAPESDAPNMISVQMYANELPLYPGYGREPDMSNFSKWGHFSQIVWKSTSEVGCATVHCPGGLANTGGGVSPYFTICNYKGPGNFGGQYAANVLPPK